MASKIKHVRLKTDFQILIYTLARYNAFHDCTLIKTTAPRFVDIGSVFNSIDLRNKYIAK